MRSDGLKIKLTRVAGLTPANVLDTPYYFQCPPEDEVTLSFGHSSTDYTVIPSQDDGDFQRVGGRQLRTAAFSTLVVDWGGFILADHFARNFDAGTFTIETLVNNLIEVSEKGAIFRVTASHNLRGVEWSWLATLPDLGVVERAGEIDARFLNITFKEWRKGISQAKRVGGKTWPKTHVLTKTDTLYNLARHYYGKTGAGRPGATAIAKANKIRNWGFGTPLVNSKRFKVGDKIKIPEMKIVAKITGNTSYVPGATGIGG